ncbi:MAG TPA: SDR family NAD(P)-dependent oxidoreductase [Saprospiraceae bacterium]|nr:SDR family NAD(P)-dependent oxidoreductase [Saprospiraceae bacterium]
MENFVLITGASSGIGEQTVRLLINHGYSVLATIRTKTDADRLRSTYGVKVHPLLMDVTQQYQVDRAFEEAARIVGNNDLVAIINNAGIAVNGAVLYVPIDEWKTQFEINLFGVIRTTQTFFPLLKKELPSNQHPRRIINISSISGLFASPFLGPYASSKFALEAMSDALRRELFMYDIQVVLIEPGSIRTPIWIKAKEKPTYFGPEHDGILAFKDKVIDKNIQESLAPEAIDKVMLKAISGKRVKPRYIIKSGKWKFQLIRLLPTRLVDKMIRKNLQSRSGIRPF